jgi:hypothetical protein
MQAMTPYQKGLATREANLRNKPCTATLHRHLDRTCKKEAPTLYLEDYLYYFNKAISEYMKTRYEVFETNQQLADDMRSWKKSFQASF